MRLILFFLLTLTLLSPAQAQPQESLEALEKQRSLLESHRLRLEALLTEQSKRIGRLKLQPKGVRRDYQLSAALRENQTLATRLTQLRDRLRKITEAALVACDHRIAQTTSVSERAQLKQRRARLAGVLSASPLKIVTKEKAGPLDSPDDLEEKADLLQDSEEKVRRQIRRVETQIAQLEHRSRLRRHSKSVDDTPFIEDSPRRTSRAQKSVSLESARAEADGASAKAPTASADPGAPPPAPAVTNEGNAYAPADDKHTDTAAPMGGWSAGEGPSRSAGGSTSSSPEVFISIKDVMDPSILTDLRRAGRGESLAARLAALQKARARLGQVAKQLRHQAADLRHQSRTLRTQK